MLGIPWCKKIALVWLAGVRMFFGEMAVLGLVLSSGVSTKPVRVQVLWRRLLF